MDAIHDHHKRPTSITQLLNPIGTSPTSLPHTQYPPPGPAQPIAHHQPPFHQPYGPANAAYGLRRATWSSDDADVPHEPRPCMYQASDSYGVPPRPASGQYQQAERDGWSSGEQGMSYGAHAAYGEHRPGPAAPHGAYHASAHSSYQPHTQRHDGHHERPPAPSQSPHQTHRPQPSQAPQHLHHHAPQSPQHSPSPANDFQPGERASVRVAIKSSTPAPQQPAYHIAPPPPGYVAYYGCPPPNYYYHPYPVPMPPAPSAPEKRPAEEPEVETPKVKKSRTNGTATKGKGRGGAAAGESKRGYTAKKREAVQTAAQNAKMMPPVAYKGKDGATASHNHQQQFAPELQTARCMSNRYKNSEFPRCVACTRRWAGDTCRFQGIRFFMKDEMGNTILTSFVENQKQDAPTMSFPITWNVQLATAHTRVIKLAVARALAPVLRAEVEHLELKGVIKRPREVDVRATCDTCMTSLFSASWMCRTCGREACGECFRQVEEMTKVQPGATPAQMAGQQARRERQAHDNANFLSCTKRVEHGYKDFAPVSRFHQQELTEVLHNMEAMVEEADGKKEEGAGEGENSPEESTGATDIPSEGSTIDADRPSSGSTIAADRPSSGSTIAADIGLPTPPAVNTADPIDVKPPPPAPSPSSSPVPGGEIPSHETPRFTADALTEEAFRALWAVGEPLVVTGLERRFKVAWTPAYFVEKYGAQNCLIVNCQADKTSKKTTVGEFFEQFGKYEGRREIWKLKDWPPSADFKSTFPELYEDFARVVPMPNYCRRDGAENIASHFPSNTIAPDLGPKMYNAFASFEEAGSHGSTKLHMDMADAINIMTYAAARADGSAGSAAWDLFKAGDSDKIRQFLRAKFNVQQHLDPIHEQKYYLHTELRAELWQKCGVKSHRVYQRPGEAVFIPAGCAHQVCNLSDCVKVASDFVSPENVARCENLTREFREQNQSMVWKEDVLQLRTMMWFAWLSCSRQEKQFVRSA